MSRICNVYETLEAVSQVASINPHRTNRSMPHPIHPSVGGSTAPTTMYIRRPPQSRNLPASAVVELKSQVPGDRPPGRAAPLFVLHFWLAAYLARSLADDAANRCRPARAVCEDDRPATRSFLDGLPADAPAGKELVFSHPVRAADIPRLCTLCTFGDPPVCSRRLLEGSSMAEKSEGTLIQAPQSRIPPPYELGGFALTTFLLSTFNAGWAPNLIWVGCAFFYGGVADLMTGMCKVRNRNTFGATAFGTYGAVVVEPDILHRPGPGRKGPGRRCPERPAAGCLLAFAIFNTYSADLELANQPRICTWCSWCSRRRNESVHRLPLRIDHDHQDGGVVGIVIDAIIAWYTLAAAVGNSMAKRTIVPVGGPLWRDPVDVRSLITAGAEPPWPASHCGVADDDPGAAEVPGGDAHSK